MVALLKSSAGRTLLNFWEKEKKPKEESLKYVRSLPDVIRVVALDVMCDRSHAEKALLVEVFLLNLIPVGTTRETSRSTRPESLCERPYTQA